MSVKNNEEFKILGVEASIIEQFFILIRDKYPLVDKANYFLEINTGLSGINVGITNQRDALSHLCTIITDNSLTYQQKLDQISNAEEHLRRAILESYEKAVSYVVEKIKKLYDEYKWKVLPIKDKYSILSSAPSLDQIHSILKDIRNMRIKGRDAKRRNKWDEEWEQGVEIFIEAFNKSKDLEKNLEEYLVRIEQINANKKQKLYFVLGIIATITTFILGSILALCISK